MHRSAASLGGAYVGPVVIAFRRPVVGTVLQFCRAVAVRLSVFLLVSARMGADHGAADLAGLPQPYPRRSAVRPERASRCRIRSNGLRSRFSFSSLRL